MKYVISNLVKSFPVGDRPLMVLKGINLEIPEGSLTAIIGNSGSGKSTLLNLLGGYTIPTAGTIVYEGKQLNELSFRSLRCWRKSRIGYLGQYPEESVFPQLSVKKNLKLALGKNYATKGKTLLSKVGLGYIDLEQKCATLSGGELQRLGLVLALGNDISVLIADEPTGNLDRDTANDLISFLHFLCSSEGLTCIMATHDKIVQDYADYTFYLTDGRISSSLHESVSNLSELTEMDLIVTDQGTLTLPEHFLHALRPYGDITAKLDLENRRVVLHFKEESL